MFRGYTPSHSSNDDVWRPTSSYDNQASNSTSSTSSSYSNGWDNARKAATDQNSPAESEATRSWGALKSTSATGWGSTTTSNSVSTNDRLPTKDTVPASNSFAADTTGRHAVSGIDSNAIGAADDEVAPVWFMERVCVQLNKNSMTAFIKEIIGNMAVIELEDHTTMNVVSSEVSMVAPKEHDSVLVTGGVDVGFEGELACIDGTDAILKDANEEFKIVDYIHVAKIVGDT